MKTRFMSVIVLAFAFAAVAGAQTKITGTAHCAKADPSYSVDVSDHPGHTWTLAKAACTWTKPMEIEGLKSKDGVDVSTMESTATKMTTNGTDVSTMDNGDKFYASFHDTTPIKDGKPGDTMGNWSFTGATGKLKGLKGKGTYTAKLQADGTVDVDVEGEYTIAAAATAAPKKK